MNYFFLYVVSTGEIYTTPYFGNAIEWTNIPEGCAVIGPFDSATASATVKDAYLHPNYYIVQNGVLTAKTTMADLQLADAQSSKLAQVKDLADKSLYTTVTSNGVTYNYSADSGYPAFQKLLLGVVAGIITYPYTLYDVNHVAVSFATVGALTLLFQDISVRENAVNTKINDYVTQAKACTTVDQVNAIVVSF